MVLEHFISFNARYNIQIALYGRMLALTPFSISVGAIRN